MAVLKLVPFIETTPPVEADAGKMVLIVGDPGAAIKVKPAIVSDDTSVITLTSPEKPTPGNATIVLLFNKLKLAAGAPPKLTPVRPVKFFPNMVTGFPAVWLVGENE